MTLVMGWRRDEPMVHYGYIKGRQVTLDLWPIGDGFYLEISAAQDFLRMRDAAELDGIKLVVNRAYATHSEQERLYRKYMVKLAEWQRGGRLGKRPPPAAAPGYSTHQAGKSVDINRAPGDDPKTEAADSPVDIWLRANAHKYNFIFDVPGEPWHATHAPEKCGEKPPAIV
jgi:LAS superfamily LD-carboxypeptidase LdcB